MWGTFTAAKANTKLKAAIDFSPPDSCSMSVPCLFPGGQKSKTS